MALPATRLKRVIGAVTAATMVAFVAACGSDDTASDGTVTLEFAQWWGAELPAGEFDKIINDFTAQNPDIKIKLLSAPYASTKQQLLTGAASKTLPDVVGLDGAWVNDFAKQGAITDITKLMADAGYDDSELASQIQLDGKTYMIPVVNFVYPLFVNKDLLTEAGVDKVPTTRTEFLDAAKKISASGGDAKGWVLPLDTAVPNGVQNDVMSWLWASGGSMLTDDGKPNLTSAEVKSTVEFVQSLNDAGVIAPGSLTMKEQDKVEKFSNGQVGMMIDSLAHINLIKENKPDLNFEVAALPAEDGFTGERGIPYASWGIGISDSTEHKAEAFKFVSYLMSQETNAKLSTIANGFPGNKTAEPDFSNSDPLFKAAFDIYQQGYPANEFVGLPKSEDLMRSFAEQLQLVLTGKTSVDEALAKAQENWSSVIE
ncbi:ABC transporter substrate-binding protein [Micromonospora endophytica]|uniref:Sugar ABC transporter substrate-binding protein n=1 Tax=Micromonospora endophytica TaxID=515350 RepID=A0A2W2CMJ5_9ACTN|nr:sugar ABC transporter substrate-binding protein [Micromonospora endophytica]PZG00732.1 sugar ABC transporter substrate-binding protein [Micromonospora endophytica]RIW44853.1 sugar ABC transporter substrate-binding protein [Micromonospora endophytica]BCJ57586.1 sugar ABC transporter substrate-binding protein [Micromonospora endophytica]